MGKSSWGCCLLKAFAVFCVLGLLVLGALGIVAYKTFHWFEGIPQSSPAVYAPIQVSPGEQEDVDRIKTKLAEAHQAKGIIDETITPNVFNAVLDAILQGERQAGKNSEVTDVRGGFEGDHFKLLCTVKPKEKSGAAQTYINLSAIFDLEINEGHITKFDLNALKAGDSEAPWFARRFINFEVNALNGALDNPNVDAKTRHDVEKLRFFKLVKREGDRIHVILDADKVQEDIKKPSTEDSDVEKKEAPKNSAF